MAISCGGEEPWVIASNQSISPDPAVVGSPVAISADFTNHYDVAETFTIKLWIDNVVVTNTTDITLAPGSTQKVTFYYTPTEAGNCMVTMGQYGGGLIGWSFNVTEVIE